MPFYRRLLPACTDPHRKPSKEGHAPEAEPLALHCQKWRKVGRALAMPGNARPCWPLRHHLVSGPGQSYVPKIKGWGRVANKGPSKGTRTRNNVLKSDPGQPSGVREMGLQCPSHSEPSSVQAHPPLLKCICPWGLQTDWWMLENTQLCSARRGERVAPPPYVVNLSVLFIGVTVSLY